MRPRSPSLEEEDDDDSLSPLPPRFPQSSTSILEEIGALEDCCRNGSSSVAPQASAAGSCSHVRVAVVGADDDDADYAPGLRATRDGEAVDRSVRTDAQAEEEADEEEAFLEAGGAEARPLEAIRGWEALREEIKEELKRMKNKNGRLTEINQLLILRNFVTLRLKGLGRMAASEHIADEWHEGEGVHFARQVRALARHFQLFEQLPIEKRGGDRGHSLLSDERVQAACRHVSDESQNRGGHTSTFPQGAQRTNLSHARHLPEKANIRAHCTSMVSEVGMAANDD